jgi:hypothetical protein
MQLQSNYLREVRLDERGEAAIVIAHYEIATFY